MPSGIYVRTEKWRKSKSKLMSKIMKGNTIRRGKKMPKSALVKLSIINTGSGNSNWRGGIKIDKDGYILRWVKNHPYSSRNYVREHRLIMENKLGRYLRPEEVIHHKNNIKSDNRIRNLKLFKNNSEHTIHHLKERYARKTKKPRNYIAK